jgi:hypothetical protein
MADMKQRRWRSMMPITGAQSELTTREMVRDSRARHGMFFVAPALCMRGVLASATNGGCVSTTALELLHVCLCLCGALHTERCAADIVLMLAI